MMSIAKVGSASGAAAYYTKDNYYTGSEHEAESTWAGDAAARLGLAEATVELAKVYETPTPVRTEPFERVLEGRPSERVQVGRLDGNGEWQHQPGFDLTFLAPKSVSILALVGGDRRLIDSHRAAVAETMALVEARLIAVQDNPKNGPKTSRLTGEGVFALFTHDLSRAHDPLLHTHAVVANMTYDPVRETWRAIDGQRLYDNRRLISNVYDGLMRRKVEELGYRTRMSGRYGAWEIPISPAAIQLQSKRRQAILERLGVQAGKTDWNTRQDVARATRDAKTNPDRDALRTEHIAELRSVGFDAAEYVQTGPKRHFRPLRARDAERLIDRHIAHLTHTRTTFTPDGLLLSLSMDAKAQLHPDRLERALQARINDGRLIPHSLSKDGEMRLTTPAMIDREREILGRLSEARSNAPLVSAEPALRNALASLPDHVANNDQKAMISGTLLEISRYIGVQGHAGTGKTSSLRRLVQLAERFGDRFEGRDALYAMAPTHKALGQLRSATGSSGAVTQQFVSDHRHLLRDRARATREERDTWSDRVVVIDESSQISYRHGADLMRILAALEPRKIILMGDRDQTNSVDAGNWFELLQDNGLPTQLLKTVVRQKAAEAHAPELLRSAQKVANGDTLGALYSLGDRVIEAPVVPPSREIDDTSDYIARAAEAAYASDSAREDYILYAPTNSLREALNDNFRDQMREDGRLGEDRQIAALRPLYTSPAFMGAASSYRAGDLLHFTKTVDRGRLEKDSLWTVINTNVERNILTIVPQGTAQCDLKAAKRHWTLKDMVAFPFNHLSARSIALAQGDEVAFGVRDAQMRIGRGDTAVVSAITGERIVLMRPRDETATLADDDPWTPVEVEGVVHESLDLPLQHMQAQSLQHAYAFTTYTVQGQSRANAYAAMQAQSDAVNRKSVGVSITREEENLLVFTNDAKALRKNAVRTDDAAIPAMQADLATFRTKDVMARTFAQYGQDAAEAALRARLQGSEAVEPVVETTERSPWSEGHELAGTAELDADLRRDGHEAHDSPEDIWDGLWSEMDVGLHHVPSTEQDVERSHDETPGIETGQEDREVARDAPVQGDGGHAR